MRERGYDPKKPAEIKAKLMDGVPLFKNFNADLKSALADSGGSNKADIVIDLANSAQSSLQSFFALIPEQDIKAVEDLFKNVKKADTNGDGRLSDDEIIFLSPNEQEIWKKRINKFG